MRRRRRKDRFIPFFVCLFAAAVLYVLTTDSGPKLRVTDTEWQVQEEKIQVESVVRNRSDHDYRITVEYLAHHYTIDAYDRALRLVGRSEVELLAAARSDTPVFTEIPFVRKIGSSYQISPTIISAVELLPDENGI